MKEVIATHTQIHVALMMSNIICRLGLVSSYSCYLQCTNKVHIDYMPLRILKGLLTQCTNNVAKL